MALPKTNSLEERDPGPVPEYKDNPTAEDLAELEDYCKRAQQCIEQEEKLLADTEARISSEQKRKDKVGDDLAVLRQYLRLKLSDKIVKDKLRETVNHGISHLEKVRDSLTELDPKFRGKEPYYAISRITEYVKGVESQVTDYDHLSDVVKTWEETDGA